MPGAADPPSLSPKPLRRVTRQPNKPRAIRGRRLSGLIALGNLPASCCGQAGTHANGSAPPMWEDRKGSMTKRITGRRLQRIRKQVFGEQPICVACKAKGKVTPAVEVDHIVALVNGGEDNHENRQALCKECHEAKTRRDLGQRERPRIGLDGWPVE